MTYTPAATGSHTITAVYSGDSGFLASASSPLTLQADTDLTRYPTLPDGAHDLSSAKLSGAYLAGADLSDANLTSANLTGANLTGADLSGVTWNQMLCPDNTASSRDGGTCLNN